ncbi:MAG: ComEC family competence protein [Muribaculaceae bacterium]|nr:ComEC family competence protein [Muribaculaceae bacterium]
MAGILLFGIGLPWYAAACVAVLSLCMLYFRNRFYTFGLMALGIGWMAACVHTPEPLPGAMHGAKVEVGARVVDMERSSDNWSMIVEADSIGAMRLGTPLRIRVTLLSDNTEAGIGSRVRVQGRLQDIRRLGDSPYEPDYGRYACVDRIVAAMSADAESFCVLSKGSGFRELMRHWREEMEDIIYLSGAAPETAAFLVATICGDDNSLSSESKSMFRTLGLAHLLALSGFHVALLAWIVSLAFMPLRLSRKLSRYRHLPVMAAVWIYVFVTGMSPSAMRAACLVTVVLLGRIMQRQSVSYNALAATALAMLAINPLMLYSPGFQLSFAAVLGLLAFSEPLNPFPRSRRIPHWLASLFTVPLAAILGTVAFSAAYFHSFPLLFLPANIIMTLMATIIIGGGVIMTFVGMCGIKLGFMAVVLDYLYGMADSFCRLLMRIPVKEITGIYPDWPVSLMLVLATVSFAVAVRRHRLRAGIMAVLFVVSGAGCAFVWSAETTRGELFIPCQSADTRIVMRHGEHAALYTEVPMPAGRATLEICRKKYSAWLHSHGCHNGLEHIDSIPDLSGLHKNGRLLTAGPNTIYMLNHNSEICSLKVDYVVIGKGPRIDIDSVAAGMRPQCIVIGPSVRSKIRKDYIQRCRECGIAVHDTTDSIFSLTWR